MRWEDLLALAEEVDAACKTSSDVDPEKARKLARGVLALPSAPDRPAKPSRPAAARVH